MTQEEAQQSTQRKIQALTTLQEQLQIILSVKKIITKENWIQDAIFYNDTEKYDIEEVKVEEKTNKKLKEKKNEDKQDKK